MTSKQLGIIIVIGLIIVAVVTNPSYDDHKRAVGKILSKITNDTSVNAESKNKWEQLGNMLGNKLIVGMIDNVLYVNNFIILSFMYYYIPLLFVDNIFFFKCQYAYYF